MENNDRTELEILADRFLTYMLVLAVVYIIFGFVQFLTKVNF